MGGLHCFVCLNQLINDLILGRNRNFLANLNTRFNFHLNKLFYSCLGLNDTVSKSSRVCTFCKSLGRLSSLGALMEVAEAELTSLAAFWICPWLTLF